MASRLSLRTSRPLDSTLASRLLLLQRLIEVELQSRLRPLQDTESAAVRQSDIGCPHIWTTETDVRRVAVGHFHRANDISSRGYLSDIAGVQGRNCNIAAGHDLEAVEARAAAEPRNHPAAVGEELVLGFDLAGPLHLEGP